MSLLPGPAPNRPPHVIGDPGEDQKPLNELGAAPALAGLRVFQSEPKNWTIEPDPPTRSSTTKAPVDGKAYTMTDADAEDAR